MTRNLSLVVVVVVIAVLGTVLALTFTSVTSSRPIADCCCDAETVDSANDNLLWSRLTQLKHTLFFRTFKVNLHNPCPFWQDDGQCALRGCAVCGECAPEEIPELWKQETIGSNGNGNGQQSKGVAPLPPSMSPFHAYASASPASPMPSIPQSFSAFTSRPSTVSANDGVLSGSLGENFVEWSDDDECMWIIQDSSNENSDVEYINLALNPESYTGYGGDSAHEVWRAIYSENCFNNGNFDDLCYEQRVFYRLLSGLQAAISAHIANNYPISPDIDVHADINEHPELYGPNVDVYDSKLGNYDDRLNNLYFAFVFLLRAVNKATPTLLAYDYSTNSDSEDALVRSLMERLLTTGIVPQCDVRNSFDESSMFREFTRIPLKQQFRQHFRNLSLIMDCVGCEKCRLHGKLQILGLGTALKILFNDRPFQLQRNEIMALIHTLAKFSNALKIATDMKTRRQMRLAKRIGVGVGVAVIVASIILMLLRRRRRSAVVAEKKQQ